MEFSQFVLNTKLAKRTLQIGLAFLGALVFSNLCLIGLALHLSQRSTTILVPMNLNTPVTVSSEGVSPTYLALMATALVGLRFNFTPKTIEQQYHWIGNFLSPEHQAAINNQLTEERTTVISQNLSSSFAVTDIQPDVQELSVKVSGALSRWVQGAPLAPLQATFLLTFKNQQGTLLLVDWLEAKP